MIDETIKKDILLLKEDLISLEVFKEYLELKKAIINSKTLQKSDKNIIFANFDSLNSEDKKRYGFIKIKSKDIPLLSNFFTIKEEIEIFKEEINKQLYL